MSKINNINDVIYHYTPRIKPDVNTLYLESDVIDHRRESRTSVTHELETLTPIGKWILDNGVEHDNTISSMGRRAFYHDTNHQRIILNESSFYDGDKWVIHYRVEFEDMNEIKLRERIRQKQKDKRVSDIAMAVTVVIIVIILLIIYT